MKIKNKASHRWLMLLVVFVMQGVGGLAIQVIGPMGSFLRAELSMSMTQYGLLFTAVNLGSVLLATTTGALVDRNGVRRIFLLGEGLVGVAMIAASRVNTPPQFMLILFLAGLANAVAGPCSSKPVVSWFGPDERATAMGVKQCAIPFAGLITGVLFPVLAAAWGWRISFAVDGGLILLLTILTGILYREPEGTRPAPVDKAFPLQRESTALGKDILLLSLGCAFLNGVQYAFAANITACLTERFQSLAGKDAAIYAGRFYSLLSFGGMVGRIGLGILSDKLLGGRRKGLLIGANAGSVLLILSVAFGLGSMSMAAIGAVLLAYGLTAAGFTGLQISLAAELTTKQNAGKATGFTLALCFVGMMAVPPAFGAVTDHSGGYFYGWLLLAGLAVIGIALCLPVREKRS